MMFNVCEQCDGPAGIHIRYEEFQPDAAGAPITPWIVLWRDMGPGEIRFTLDEWRWVTGDDRPG